MGYNISVWDCTCPAIHEEFKRLKRKFTKLCKDNKWTLISFTAGHYYLSGFIRDLNGNYVYFLKQDWDSNSILVRIAKSRKDYTGGNNHFIEEYNLERRISALFEWQDVKRCKRLLCRKFKRK